MIILQMFCLFAFGDLGGGVRVRTRNALHEVGADLTRDDRYPTVLDWRRATARASEPQPHILQFLTISHFSIISFYHKLLFLLKLIISYKTSKTRVNSTRFQAI